MRKVAGIYMTEVRYQELYRREAVSKLSPVQKVNEYFFDCPEITASTALCFYGFIVLSVLAICLTVFI